MIVKGYQLEPNANLVGADLSGLDLQNVDLRGADLIGANLCGCKLKGAQLQNAKLAEANLRNADLGGFRKMLFGAIARRLGANLSEADLTGADLTGANLSGTTCDEASFNDAIMRDVSLDWAGLPGATFRQAILERATGKTIYMAGAQFHGANLCFAELIDLQCGSCMFIGSNLQNANFSKADLALANFKDAFFFDTIMAYAHLESTTMPNGEKITLDVSGGVNSIWGP